MKPDEVKKLVEDAGGKATSMGGPLPDGSGFATASFPLPKDHWIYWEPEKDDKGISYEPPPMTHRLGTDSEHRKEWVEKIRAAGKYAVRASTMRGKDMDFDPDAMIQNLVVGMLGYNTPDGLSSDAFANP